MFQRSSRHRIVYASDTTQVRTEMRGQREQLAQQWIAVRLVIAEIAPEKCMCVRAPPGQSSRSQYRLVGILVRTHGRGASLGTVTLISAVIDEHVWYNVEEVRAVVTGCP